MNLSLAPQPWMRIFLTILVALLLTYTCGRNAQSSAAEALAPTPQFVSITFDDNFGLAAPGAVGGVRAVTEFFAGKHNPTGTGNEAVFDGTPISTTFFNMCVYMVDRSGKVIGGYRGEDWKGRNRSAWKAAFAAGNEMADHTVNHFNGGTAPINQDDCCRARDWDFAHWTNEIDAARKLMTDRQYGLGAKNVIGFRAPYLSFNDAMFSSLQTLGFLYDSSLPNCFADDEDGSNCSWPYLLDHGSADAESFARKVSASAHRISLPRVQNHPGLWELPVTSLIIPPDAVASKYHFKPGLRDRIALRGALPYPSFYEQSSAKITGLDYTLLIDAGVTGDEMRAILEYNLDLHLSGNRSPLVFVAHAHLYTFSTPEDNPTLPRTPNAKLGGRA